MGVWVDGTTDAQFDCHVDLKVLLAGVPASR